MRVAVLIRKWSFRSGNERVAAELSRYLYARGHEVRVFCQKVDDSAVDVLPRDRIERLPGLPFDPSLAMLTFATMAASKVRRLRRASAVDVVIGFNHSIVQDVYRLGGGTMAELLALTGRTGAGRGGPVVDRVALWLERARLRRDRYKLLVAPSLRVKEELERHYRVDPDTVEVVWNGIDLDRFRPERGEGEREGVRARWGVGPAEPVLLFVGQDPERKGFDIAVRVAACVGARLVYVGKAKRPRDLAGHVVWDGERADVERCYRSAEALIAPSRYDPFGGVVLEALACGLPAVAVNRIGATERARGTILESLFVSDPEDVVGLAERARIALDPASRGALQEAARQIAAGASLSAWGARMEAVLERARIA